MPAARGFGFRSIAPEDSSLPAELRTLLRESLEQACSAGVNSGYPLTDLEVRVAEAPFQIGITTELGLRAAAQRGLILAAREASPTLLEPVMALELIVPSEYSGQVLGTLAAETGPSGGDAVPGRHRRYSRAQVPLSEMFGYMTELRSATRGRGTFTMEFSHYDAAPPEALRRLGLA